MFHVKPTTIEESETDMSDTLTVEIPAEVKDNSQTVTDYAFRRDRSPDHGVTTPDRRDRAIRTAVHHLVGYRHYQWTDVNPDGQRCQFNMILNREGDVTYLLHTEYFTRVACSRGNWCHSYAAHYTMVSDAVGDQSDPVPYCNQHTNEMQRQMADAPSLTLHLSEPLLIGQHD